MKKYCLLILRCSTFSFAQFSINGTLTKVLESDWIVLYKIESTQQVFVANTTIKRDSLLTNGKKVAIGTFSFNLPATAKSGTYRVKYRMKGAGFLDFILIKKISILPFIPIIQRQRYYFLIRKKTFFTAHI